MHYREARDLAVIAFSKLREEYGTDEEDIPYEVLFPTGLDGEVCDVLVQDHDDRPTGGYGSIHLSMSIEQFVIEFDGYWKSIALDWPRETGFYLDQNGLRCLYNAEIDQIVCETDLKAYGYRDLCSSHTFHLVELDV